MWASPPEVLSHILHKVESHFGTWIHRIGVIMVLPDNLPCGTLLQMVKSMLEDLFARPRCSPASALSRSWAPAAKLKVGS